MTSSYSFHYHQLGEKHYFHVVQIAPHLRHLNGLKWVLEKRMSGVWFTCLTSVSSGLIQAAVT